MTRLENFINSKKIIIFDLDGVILNTKKNMELSWNHVDSYYNLKTSFNEYFKYIGLPFKKILIKLNIKKNHNKIQKSFNKKSLKSINCIKLYPKVRITIKKLKKKQKKIGILTSKDFNRTKKILRYFKLKFDFIECPKQNIPGKPYPYQMLNIIKKLKFSKKNTVYIGDMIVDFKTARNAGVDFINANYGYGEKKKYKYKINNLKELTK